MKRILAGVLCLLMVLALSACAVQIAFQPKNTQPPSAAAETTAPLEQEDMAEIQGSFADGVYTNTCLGIQGVFDESWYIASDEERMELMGILAEEVNEEALAEQFRSAGNIIVFYAQDSNGSSVNMTIEDLGLRSAFITEEIYVAASLEQIPEVLESMGVSFVRVDQTTYSISGVEHAAVDVHGYVNGVDFHEKIVCIQAGNYMGAITAACYGNNLTAKMLRAFSAI
ncbi:MAG TPA: hypothetical protein IAC31_01825 [Candidatus Faecousia intestinigallinarum]|nr:hypothetical protein [Candidatus Faecousia intestinigallinarum]